jgi:PiT family inorganic phosphate transporter
VALAFDYTNGFHDAANAIATSVSTRALTPASPLALAAVMNLIGAFLGQKVAKTVADTISAPGGQPGTARRHGRARRRIVWNLITWYFGLPSSSSHALIGGLIGAGLASSSGVHWATIFDKVAIPMVVSPLVGFTIAYLFMVAILWWFRRSSPRKVNRGFRFAQTVSRRSWRWGTGLQDAQKTMGVIVLALVAGGYQTTTAHPGLGGGRAAAAISPGRTPAAGASCARSGAGHRDRPARVASPPRRRRPASSTPLPIVFGAPISTTHTISSAIMGVGATKRLSAVRWGVAGNIVTAWVLTIPMAATVRGGDVRRRPPRPGVRTRARRVSRSGRRCSPRWPARPGC